MKASPNVKRRQNRNVGLQPDIGDVAQPHDLHNVYSDVGWNKQQRNKKSPKMGTVKKSWNHRSILQFVNKT